MRRDCAARQRQPRGTSDQSYKLHWNSRTRKCRKADGCDSWFVIHFQRRPFSCCSSLIGSIASAFETSSRRRTAGRWRLTLRFGRRHHLIGKNWLFHEIHSKNLVAARLFAWAGAWSSWSPGSAQATSSAPAMLMCHRLELGRCSFTWRRGS